MQRASSPGDAEVTPEESKGSRPVVPPGPPEPNPHATGRPDDLLPPPPEGWGSGRPVRQLRDYGEDDLQVLVEHPHKATREDERDADGFVLARIEKELASVRRAWMVGVITAAILGGVVIYALLSSPAPMRVEVMPDGAALHKANGRIATLESKVADLKREIEHRTTNAGGRLKSLKRCFNQALRMQQHRTDLLLKRRLTAKHYLKLSPPQCST